jgi:two-component system, NarL family, response regulator NreC
LAIKILVVDDHMVVRAGLKALIQSDASFEIIGEAAGGLEAISLADKLQPDVMVLDLSMPDMDGILVTKELHAKFPQIRILILTVHEDDALLREVIRSGASGYILKNAAERELNDAIKRVFSGEMYVDPKLLPTLFRPNKSLSSKSGIKEEPLTVREVDVLKLIVDGYTNRQIGEELSISVRTVEGHRSNIYEKLGLHSRVELVRFARDHGLLK